MIYPWLFNFSDSLTNIDLSFNELNDTIPEAFGAFTPLQKLDLTGTSLKGRIPPSFGNFSNLRSLYLGRNGLEEDLPSFFHLLEPAEKSPTLQELHLYDNDMRGSFPERFERTSNLVILDVSDNQITGLLPDLSALSSLRELYIDLSSNNFFGPVPLFPSNALKLILGDNMFSGSVSFLCNFTIIYGLEVSNNQLSEDLPDCWMNIIQILFLNLENNKFSGRIPTSLGSLSQLKMLSMRSNRLTGELPVGSVLFIHEGKQ
ncbi:putative non-specific serine/threonine protein kinase [Helianthus annuus]|uniref:Non-specific serine/threonine protein kinase n=2 Tax=Helianthus annuus TaxID=4232 RepID=A0A9K3JX55_HELAN|nr:putative non-specific serine/threonine protein kinase [Helianthus annuus]KAJ0627819.1 putative non-specific serine/threonine protein kinase [Helianthus annuus]KAJ0949103.1 putative non-specific serine/threonine protein kinase [Helianthus annuus]KAJ0957921.1 putative non-specific serine/threonine protein kinase [Helianthus annuus]